MLNIRKTKLKYICSSFSSNISTTLIPAERNNESIYEVYGASGIIGYHKFYYYNKEYLGIIKDGAGVGRINLYPKNTSLLGTMAYIIPKTNIDINWLKYCIASLNLSESLDKTTIPHIYFSDYGNKEICIYPLDYQKKIASFLDNKCEKIDQIYKDVEKQIETLEQYKRSIITESVTKGINKEVTLIEDKNEWFLCIPTKWIKTRIGAVYKLRNTKVSDKDYMPLSVTMKGVVPQLENAAKTDAHDDRKLVKKGDFAINSRSDRRGSCGIAPCDGSISLINIVLEPKQNMNSRYYNWLFHTTEFADEFYKWGHGIVDDLWTTTWQEMKNIIIPMPPISEQEEIANFLDKKCAEIDSIIEDKKKQLEILEDYKKSLIYEFVTGKKEVPNE